MKRIIIIDDDPGIQRVLALIFNASEFKVFVYSSAEPFINNQFELPDIFLIDKQLPGINGISLCRHLKSCDITRHIPVILYSASPDIYTAAIAAGANEAIEKPFSIRVLRAMVIRLISQSDDPPPIK